MLLEQVLPLGAHFYVFTVLVQASAWLCDELDGGLI